MLLLARIIADKVLLPDSPLAKEVAIDQNPAAGAVAAASFLLVAVLFAGSVHPGNATDASLEAAAATPAVAEEAAP